MKSIQEKPISEILLEKKVEQKIVEIASYQTTRTITLYNREKWRADKNKKMIIYSPKFSSTALHRHINENSFPHHNSSFKNDLTAGPAQALKKILALHSDSLKHILSIYPYANWLNHVDYIVTRPLYIANNSKELTAFFSPQNRILCIYISNLYLTDSHKFLEQWEKYEMAERVHSVDQSNDTPKIEINRLNHLLNPAQSVNAPWIFWILHTIAKIMEQKKLNHFHYFYFDYQNHRKIFQNEQTLLTISDFFTEKEY